MRAFLAIDPSDGARAEVARVQEDLRSALALAPVAWDRPEKLHLTLKYLGDVHDLDAVLRAVGDATSRSSPLDLALGPLGTFGSPRPKVVWVGLEGDLARLRELVGALERAVAPLGFPPEDRPYAPHITLGRVREARGRLRADDTRALADALRAARPAAPTPFVATEVVLYESRSGADGAVYVPRAHLPLG